MSKNLLNKLNTSLNNGELFKLVDDSLAVSQVMQKLGFSNKGQYISITKQFLLDNDVDISHFTPNGQPLISLIEKICPVCNSNFKTEPRKLKEQVTCSRSCSNTYFRTKDQPTLATYRQKALSYYGCQCNRCGFSNLLALQVHHKDKDRNNNCLTNLEVLCSNCHLMEHSKS